MFKKGFLSKNWKGFFIIFLFFLWMNSPYFNIGDEEIDIEFKYIKKVVQQQQANGQIFHKEKIRASSDKNNMDEILEIKNGIDLIDKELEIMKQVKNLDDANLKENQLEKKNENLAENIVVDNDEDKKEKDIITNITNINDDNNNKTNVNSIKNNKETNIITNNSSNKNNNGNSLLAKLGKRIKPIKKLKPCMIAIIADGQIINTLGVAAFETWVQEIRNFCDFRFFIGNVPVSAEIKAKFGDSLVILDEADLYPPINKVFALWKYLYDHFGANYKWFLKIDGDAFLNPRVFKSLVQNYIAKLPVKNPYYVGNSVSGRKAERSILGLNVPYCMGLGYLVNRKLLSDMGPELDNCLDTKASNHSDTEIGRCVFKVSGARCIKARSSFRQLYNAIDENGVVQDRKLNANNQMTLAIPYYPDVSIFDSAIIHSVKQPEEFYRLHTQLKYNLRPVLSVPPKKYKTLRSQSLRSCVNNRLFQIEKRKTQLSECPAVKSTTTPSLDFDVFLLNDDENVPKSGNAGIEDEDSELEAIEKRFAQGFNFRNVYVESKTVKDQLVFRGFQGEYLPLAEVVNELDLVNLDTLEDVKENDTQDDVMVAHKREALVDDGKESDDDFRSSDPLKKYKAKMKTIIQFAKISNMERFAVFDKSVLFRNDFVANFAQTMNDKRCGGYTFNYKHGGLFLFGSRQVATPIPESPKDDALISESSKKVKDRAWVSVSQDLLLATAEINLKKKRKRFQTGVDAESPRCYNVDSHTYGSYGVLYDTSAYDTILNWIDDDRKYNVKAPFDDLYAHLAVEGFTVRSAFPPLVLSKDDLKDKDTKWDKSDYSSLY